MLLSRACRHAKYIQHCSSNKNKNKLLNYFKLNNQQERKIFNNTSYKHNESTAVTTSSPGKGFKKLGEIKKFKTEDYQKKYNTAANDSGKSKWSLTSLLVGFGVGSVAASVYFNQLVHNDIWICTGRIESRLEELKQQADDESKQFRHRISILEKELRVIKTKIQNSNGCILLSFIISCYVILYI